MAFLMDRIRTGFTKEGGKPLITLENDHLRVLLSPVGGTLQSIYGKKTDIEYLWQGDKAYWGGRAPNLFPFVGRLYEKKYTVHGKEYEMGIHGFVNRRELTVETQEAEKCVFLLRDSEETLVLYPYHFEYRLHYTLDENRLLIACSVKNLSEETMYFGMGGHPGFNVPLVKGLAFEDYSISFSEACVPQVVRFSPGVLTTGQRDRYPLADHVRLPLRHDLFTEDAVVLANAPRCVTLSTPRDPHGVRVSYPGMPYVGFWHKPNTDAPYVCVEPWSVLPGREGVVEELTEMADMTTLSSGDIYENKWFIEVW